MTTKFNKIMSTIKIKVKNLFADMQQDLMNGYSQADNINTRNKIFTSAQDLFQRLF